MNGAAREMIDVSCDTPGWPTVIAEGNLLLVTAVCAELRRSGCIHTITGSLDPSDKQLMQTNSLNNHFSVLLNCSAVL